MRLEASLFIDDKRALHMRKDFDHLDAAELLKRPDYERHAMARMNGRAYEFQRLEEAAKKRQKFIEMVAMDFAVALTNALDNPEYWR
jgi:hypothetical protein